MSEQQEQILPVALRHQVGEFRLSEHLSIFAWVMVLRAAAEGPGTSQLQLRINQGLSSFDKRGGRPGRAYSPQEMESLALVAEFTADQIVTIRPAEALYDFGANRFLLLRLRPTLIHLLDGYNSEGDPIVSGNMAVDQIAIGPQRVPFAGARGSDAGSPTAT